MHCVKCGNKVGDKARFCSKCGGVLGSTKNDNKKALGKKIKEELFRERRIFKLKQNTHPYALRLVPFSTRFYGFIIDTLCIGVLEAIFYIITPSASHGNSVFGLLLYFLYYFLFEVSIGKTPGKFITRTSVVDLGGTSQTVDQALVRTISRFIPFEPLSFLFSGSAWHDKLSRTMVVRTGSLKGISLEPMIQEETIYDKEIFDLADTFSRNENFLLNGKAFIKRGDSVYTYDKLRLQSDTTIKILSKK